MRSRRYLILLCLFPLFASAETVEKIVIDSVKSGWGYQEKKVEIVKKGDGYYRGNDKVDTILVQNLMKVLNDPVLMKLSFENLKIDQPWLHRNKEKFLDRTAGVERQLYEEAMRNPATIEKATNDYYQSRWTDDSAKVDVEITTSAGVISVKSNAQHAFMIPWLITFSKDKVKNTWDANIGRSIAALMPDGMINLDRLAGYNLASALKHSLQFGMGDFFESHKAREKFAPEIKQLERKYRLSEFHVSSMSGLGFSVNGLHVVVSEGDLSKGVVVDAHLPSEKDRLQGINKFYNKVPVNGDLVNSVPWFMDWLKANPNAKAEITMVDDVSITGKGKESLKEDFAAKRPNLFKEISAVWDQTLLITVKEGRSQYSRWLLFPDRRMVLWHATGLPVLKWKAEELPKPSSRYGQMLYGVIVSPEGSLQAVN